MELEVITIGGSYFLDDVFNFAAVFTNAAGFKNFLGIALAGSVIYFSFQILIYGKPDGILKYLVLLVLINGLVFGPKARVVLTDPAQPIAFHVRTIDNVPFFLAWIASVTTLTSYSLTARMEDLLGGPDDLAYEKAGDISFGATLLAKSTRYSAVTGTVSENLTNFFESCMITGNNLGYFETDALTRTGNMTAFIDANVPNSLAFFDVETRSLKPCKTGWPELKTKLGQEIATAIAKRVKFNEPVTANLGAAITDMMNRDKAAIEAFQRQIHMTGASATAHIQQAMLINSLDTSIQHMLAKSGNSAAMSSYQAARAEAQTSASYSALGAWGLTATPILLIFLQSLYFAMFPIAIFMILTPLGWTIVKGYLSGFLWLASWGPMHAIVNAFVLKRSYGLYQEKMGSFSDPNTSEYILTFANHLGVRSVEGDVATLAGSLMMSIPFLSLSIFFGANRMMGLATSMLAAPQQAATETGREAATGTIGLGNTSMNNLAANKLNSAWLNDHTRSMDILPNGAFQNTNADGSITFDRGSAVSNSSITPQISSALMQSSQENFERALASERSEASGFTSAVSNAASYYQDVGSQVADSASAQKGQSTDTSLRGQQEISESWNNVQDWAEKHNVTGETAMSVGLGLNAAAKAGGKFGPGELSASLGGDASLKLNGQSTEQFLSSLSAEDRKSLQDSTSVLVSAVDSASTHESWSDTITSADGNRFNSENVTREAHEWRAAQTELERASATKSLMEQKGSSYAMQITDALSGHWREIGKTSQDIATLQNPHSVAEIQASKEAIEEAMPHVLQKLGLAEQLQGVSTAGAFTPQPSHITSNMPEDAFNREAFNNNRGEITGKVDHLQSAFGNKLSDGASAVQSGVEQRQEGVEVGQDRGPSGALWGQIDATGTRIMDTIGVGNVSTKSAQELQTHIPVERPQTLSAAERDAVIRTIAAEAGGESAEGQIAVANVIRNRMEDPRYPASAEEVVMQPNQFSAWNDPANGGNSIGQSLDPNSEEYREIGTRVDQVMSGHMMDNTSGATHYYAPSGMDGNAPPDWFADETNARDSNLAPRIGNHVFTGQKQGGTS